MRNKLKKEVRVQFLRPRELIKERAKVPLLYLPVAPLEWHGPHLPLGVDALNAEQAALAAAVRTGGVVLPTLYSGTERERPPAMLESLGFRRDEYVLGMDFPRAKGLYRSFYFPEEIFALTVRAWLEQGIEHGYQYVYIVNGHGAFNHNEVLKRLCLEFSNTRGPVRVAYSLAFPEEEIAKAAIGHADAAETALMMHLDRDLVALDRLPPPGKKLKYADYSIVDSGGFSGSPGAGHTVPDRTDPRRRANAARGKKMFDQTVNELVAKVKEAFGL
jgi:creatinine amidohydrolase